MNPPKDYYKKRLDKVPGEAYVVFGCIIGVLAIILICYVRSLNG